MNPDELQKKKLVDSDYLKKVLKFGKKKFTTTMDDVFEKKKIIPNILKMDVLGAEG